MNVAHGSVVDEDALIAALQMSLGQQGWMFAANRVPEVFTMDNVVLTPHIGSATVETRRAMGDLTVDNLSSIFLMAVITPIPNAFVDWLNDQLCPGPL